MTQDLLSFIDKYPRQNPDTSAQLNLIYKFLRFRYSHIVTKHQPATGKELVSVINQAHMDEIFSPAAPRRLFISPWSYYPLVMQTDLDVVEVDTEDRLINLIPIGLITYSQPLLPTTQTIWNEFIGKPIPMPFKQIFPTREGEYIPICDRIAFARKQSTIWSKLARTGNEEAISASNNWSALCEIRKQQMRNTRGGNSAA